MTFNVREVTIHLMGGPAPCLPASPDPDPLCPAGTCRPTQADPACKGKSNRPPHPQGDEHPGGRKRSLDLLQAQLRETLAPPPL